MSDQLVWQLVRGHNAFIRKGLNGLVLSAEPGNLYNKHSYKYSGLANSKTIDIAEEDGAIAVTLTRPKNKSKPAQYRSKSVSKKRVQRQAPGMAKLASSVRPDLKKAAVARVTAIAKSQRAAGAKSKSS
mmetsp:Transcript_6210/g.17818  ORF Transcript_6210/g.17818 Transcript_6210/m.17818 type:complete len:129 (+) Transcript_6210:122-508(+)|eukprot:CAMPEP_0206149264 /NCGR_PEP_ID=MMETSP1473-20131121/37690_1 /ASSEMBLY_ACC=CAM_ASM_001109 /TAXON_ID=1461547 /ORGANISM="Stichococcus sp, Strain RCC1054" /LENGTH=128 /DNA_ID=CAMNT_0053546719 /DNA_START=937 /DNA_END=1323 /DNA_ORIENTATION=-